MFIKLGLATLLIFAIGLVWWLKPIAETLTPSVATSARVTVTNGVEGLPLEQDTRAQNSLVDSLSQPDTLIEETVNAQFEDIASAFAQTIQYPAESLPIFDASAIVKYQANRGAAMQLKEHGVRLSLQTTQLNYQSNQAITGTVEVNGIEQARVDLSIVQLGQVIASTSLITNNITQFAFPAMGQAWTEAQVLVVAQVTNNSQEWTVSTPINLFNADQSTAQLDELQNSYVDGAWLIIPVKLMVTREAFYRLEANLYSKTEHRPLLHLSAEKELASGHQTLLLKAHISALKAMGDEGDYSLADIALEQMPSAPNYETISGITKLTSGDVRGFAFNNYDDEPHSDDDAKARLEFLQGIASRK